MGGFQQPYMYDADRRDLRFPLNEFDPKAVTRASWEAKPKKPMQDGPLVSFNRRPDLHKLPPSRTTKFRPMSGRIKSWIRWMRHVQQGLRALELVGGVGLLVLMILISKVDFLTSWVLRITGGVVAISCIYAIYHLKRPAGARTPASSAAYQLFAAFTDLAILPLYAFGALAVTNHGKEWTTLLANQSITAGYFTPSVYYLLISAGGCHLVSLAISLWLGLMFRRIASMPPDMNPLEDNLTARHKRNKSSIATDYTSMSEKRLSTPLEERRRSGAPYETLSRPPSIPFMHTRSNSNDSMTSSKRDSRMDLPSCQYQIVPANSSPRKSVASAADMNLNRFAKPASASGRGSYTEIPLQETGIQTQSSPRASSVTAPPTTSPTRQAKFTEAWYASESLISRTQQRQRAMMAATTSSTAAKTRAYEALTQRYDMDSDGDSDQENNAMRPDAGDITDLDDDNSNRHPNPLRSNPTPVSMTSSSATPAANGPRLPRTKTPYRPRRDSALSEISLNSRSACQSQDIADWKRNSSSLDAPSDWGRNRISSIQPEDAFYSQPYGDLKPAKPPVMVGGSRRQVSSGNDYADLGTGSGYGYYRRNVSGKVVEEGMAGKRYSRYSVLNDD